MADRQDSYKYAFGTIEQIKNADFENMLVSDNINDFSGFQADSGSGIVLPEFTGVYQETSYIANPLEDNEYELPVDILMDNIGTLAGEIVYFDEEDNIDHDLIALIYGSKSGWDSDLVRSLLGENSQRVSIISDNNLPDFSKKDVHRKLVKIWDDIKNYQGTVNEKRQKLKNTCGTAIEKISNQLKSYGLTHSEYVSFKVLRELQ
jgi:hypothetical protein